MPAHHHDEACVVFTLAGSFVQAARGREGILAQDSILYLPAGEAHANVFGPHGAHCLVGRVDESWLNRRLGTSRVETKGPSTADGGPLCVLARKIYCEFVQPDALSPLIMEGAFLELVGRWFREDLRQTHGAPAWLRRVKAFLQDTFSRPVSLAELSQVAGVHPSHLAREFHRFYGLTVGEYVRKLRVEFIAERLCASQGPTPSPSLAQLALDSGFGSQAHMSFAFKRATGMTPTEYRKAHGKTSIP